MGLNIFFPAPCAQIQEALYWEYKLFKASAAAPLGLPVLSTKASIAMQDEIRMHLLKGIWNKIKSCLRFAEYCREEISPSVILSPHHIFVVWSVVRAANTLQVNWRFIENAFFQKLVNFRCFFTFNIYIFYFCCSQASLRVYGFYTKLTFDFTVCMLHNPAPPFCGK